MINELIKETKFSVSDPFDFQKEIISDKFKKFSAYDDFAKDLYLEWIYFTYAGEVEATITYPIIHDIIKNKKYTNYFDGISEKEIEKMCEYFDGMIKEENAHAVYFYNLLNNIYGDEVSEKIKIANSSEVRDYFINFTQTEDFVKILTQYYIGECYLFAVFYSIFTQSHNENTKQIFKPIMVDEVNHINNFKKILKNIKKNITLDKSDFIQSCKYLRYIGFDFVSKKFGLNHLHNDKKTKKVLNLIYDNDWHKEFAIFLTKQWYALFSILYPNITIKEFHEMIYSDDSINT
jgi:rubrerythrin